MVGLVGDSYKSLLIIPSDELPERLCLPKVLSATGSGDRLRELGSLGKSKNENIT